MKLETLQKDVNMQLKDAEQETFTLCLALNITIWFWVFIFVWRNSFDINGKRCLKNYHYLFKRTKLIRVYVFVLRSIKTKKIQRQKSKKKTLFYVQKKFSFCGNQATTINNFIKAMRTRYDERISVIKLYLRLRSINRALWARSTIGLCVEILDPVRGQWRFAWFTIYIYDLRFT